MRRSSTDTGGTGAPVQNGILHALPPATLLRLQGSLRVVSLQARQVIYQAGEPITDIYFIESGLCSLRTSTRDGQSVEAVSVGREGMLGLHALLGASTIPAEVVVQIGGHALAVGADVIGHEMAREPRLHDAIHRYAHGLIVHAMQSVACSRLHSLEERFCRWILGALDCIDGDRIPVTQELLAATLGVRRPSLTLAARALQETGAISYRRGEVRVQQRPVLEATACECYGIVRKALALQPRTARTR